MHRSSVQNVVWTWGTSDRGKNPGLRPRSTFAMEEETALLEHRPSQAVTPDRSSQLLHDPVDIHELSIDRTSQRTHPVNPSERRPPIDQSTVDPSGRSSRRDFILRIPRSQVDERGPSSSSARTDHHVPEQTPPPLRHGDRIPRSQVDERGPSSSSARTDPHVPEQTPPPLRRGDRIRRRGWMERSPYTDPCQPKRARVMPPPEHVWNPHGLVHPEQLAAYEDYKRSTSGELRDVDLHDLVGVPITWFHRLQTNLMELEDTHVDAYLKIIRRHQRLHPTVYGSRINILDSQFFTLLDHQWDRIGTGPERKPPAGWSVFGQTWSHDELAVVRGELPLGIRPWHDVDLVLIPCNVGGMHWVMASIDLQWGHILVFDSFRREVPFRHRNAQFACLRYLLPSQLYTVHFHRNRQPGDKSYRKKDGPFRMLFVSADRVPQQELGGNCGAHTLRMIEYLTANRDTFDWTEADMPIIRQKMAIEVYCNSRIL
ncbi:hypothetical protein LWI29_035844 [Acer saccharum]|uniref:Ubiquitin-like protease family profile domain-containing protein n=1 Tax=Acer saccharum TaxID=4024 RepID=A0AA39W162_ACESA|nr:hypothetical protein LWI29_035844 [Acer saccharum]